VFRFTFHTTPLVDAPYTELSTAVLLLLTSYALLVAIQRSSLPLFLLTGPLMGCCRPFCGDPADAPANCPNFAMVVGMAATVSPWMVRNHRVIGDTKISQRGSR
jgi:hypothetical protein